MAACTPPLLYQNRGINDIPLNEQGITGYLASSSVAFTILSVLAETPMIVISHVFRFSPLLSVLLTFRLISSKGDELGGVIDSLPPTLLKEQSLMPLDGAPNACYDANIFRRTGHCRSIPATPCVRRHPLVRLGPVSSLSGLFLQEPVIATVPAFLC